jgi:hypothetical protein
MTDGLDDAIAAQIDQMRANGELEVRPEPRCRVCRDEQSRLLVNKLLAHGLTLRDIEDVIKPLNRNRPQRDRINLNNLREHRRRHFDIQSPANAVYRRIVEQRAAEANIDLENGVGTAVTYLAYLDTMMAKGFATLMAEDTVVSYRDGADAGRMLNDLTRKDAGATQQAQMMAEMDRVISVVKEVCTPEQLSLMSAKLNGTPDAPTPVAARRVTEPFDPSEDHDEYDEFED